MGFDPNGLRVLVTGASSGMGAAMAQRFAAAGATVGICARRAEPLHEVLERCQAHSPASRIVEDARATAKRACPGLTHRASLTSPTEEGPGGRR